MQVADSRSGPVCRGTKETKTGYINIRLTTRDRNNLLQAVLEGIKAKQDTRKNKTYDARPQKNCDKQRLKESKQSTPFTDTKNASD